VCLSVSVFVSFSGSTFSPSVFRLSLFISPAPASLCSDDEAGGDVFDSMDTPENMAQDHAGGGSPYLAWDAYAYTPWVRSITPTKAPKGEWHQRRWSMVLRALWDKKYYLKPYYAAEPQHTPVLKMLHLKDYLLDMGYRNGDGRGEPPEAKRLMASGNADSSGKPGVPVPGRELGEAQRLSHAVSGKEHPFSAEMHQGCGREHGMQLAAPAKNVASDAEWKGMEREANGGEEKQNEIGNEESASSDSSAPRAAADSLKFFTEWGGAARNEVLSSSEEKSPPTSPGGVAKWWGHRKHVVAHDSGDIWNTVSERRQRAQERVAAKAHLLDQCFGTLHHEPARSLVMYNSAQHVSRAWAHASRGGSAEEDKTPKNAPGLARKEAMASHELEKDDACRMLRSAGGGDWL